MRDKVSVRICDFALRFVSRSSKSTNSQRARNVEHVDGELVNVCSDFGAEQWATAMHHGMLRRLQEQHDDREFDHTLELHCIGHLERRFQAVMCTQAQWRVPTFHTSPLHLAVENVNNKRMSRCVAKFGITVQTSHDAQQFVKSSIVRPTQPLVLLSAMSCSVKLPRESWMVLGRPRRKPHFGANSAQFLWISVTTA